MQFESLAGFSAVVDRLGQFQEAMAANSKTPSLLPPGQQAAPASSGNDSSAAGSTSTSISSGGADSSSSSSSSSSDAQAPSIMLQYEAHGRVGATDTPEASTSGSSNSSSSSSSGGTGHEVLLELQGLCVATPDGAGVLVEGLDVQVGPACRCWPGHSCLNCISCVCVCVCVRADVQLHSCCCALACLCSCC